MQAKVICHLVAGKERKMMAARLLRIENASISLTSGTARSASVVRTRAGTHFSCAENMFFRSSENNSQLNLCRRVIIRAHIFTYSHRRARTEFVYLLVQIASGCRALKLNVIAN